MTLRRHFLFALLAAGIAAGSLPAAAQDESITVFAAASMKNALDDINAAFLKATGTKVVASYAASSALAKQLEQGAPATGGAEACWSGIVLECDFEDSTTADFAAAHLTRDGHGDTEHDGGDVRLVGVVALDPVADQLRALGGALTAHF